MFRPNVARPVIRPQGGGTLGSGTTFALLGMMMLLFLLVVVVLLIILLKRRKDKKERRTRGERERLLNKMISDHRENLYIAGEDVGINREDVDDIILDTSNLVCVVYPENGVCDPRFYVLKDGCCKLKSDADQQAAELQEQMIRDITTEIVVLIVAEIIVTSILPKIGSRIVGLTSRALARVVARTAQATAAKIALKMTQFAGRVLVKLGSGPVGWALLVFEMISLTLDLADLRNYDSFIENKSNMQARDIMIQKFHEAIILDEGAYPVLFPTSLIFPEESNVAADETTTYMMTNYMEELLEVEGGAEYLSDMIILAMGSEEETLPETPEQQEEGLRVIEEWISRVRRKHGRELDKYKFDILQDELPASKRDDIFLVPSMSSETTEGISISEEAAQRWNSEKRSIWFDYLDPFFPPNIPEANWVPPFVAVYTNTYLKPNMLNPGTLNEPNLVTDTLPRKVTLMYPFGPLISNCEKPRTSAQYKEPINPQDFGVKFNAETGVCEYTRSYCDRYVIDYKNKTWKDGTPYPECELTSDQKWAETFLGTNIVRDAKRYWDDPAQIPADIRDLYNDRKERHGPALATYMMISDPLGFGETREGFVASMQEKMAGKDRYCLTGDTCKYFTAKHDGGNFMTWTAKNSDGVIYPHPQLGVQGQVKVGEDHTFYIPEGGEFRVKCDPGEGGNFSYDEIPANGTKKFTCYNGKLNKDFSIVDTAVAAGEAVVDAVESTEVSVGEDGVSVSTPIWSADVGDGGASIGTPLGGVSVGKKGKEVDINLPGGGIEVGGDGLKVDTFLGGLKIGGGGVKFSPPKPSCTIM